VPLPTLIIHQGTVVVDDRRQGKSLPSLEINHVNLNIINDPLATVVINGRAKSGSLGDLEIHGTWNRQTKELAFSIQVNGMPLTTALLQRLAPSCPAGDLDKALVEGKADIKAEVTWMPGSPAPFTYDISADLSGGKLRHPRIPLPLEDLDAKLHLNKGGLELVNLKARSGASRIWAKGKASLPCPEANFEGALEVQHLELCDKLFQKLPALEAMVKAFSPAGLATVRIACRRQDGAWKPLTPLPGQMAGTASTLSLIPENTKVVFSKFPYPLERLSGAVDMNLLTKCINVDIVGYSGPRPVHVTGTWQGKAKDADARFDISASDLPLDDKLLFALHASPYEGLARSFHANGQGDIKAYVRHVPGKEHFDNEFHVHFHDADFRWEQFP
jgi:hypothetical protein